jgi:hypothetical protein
MIGHFKVTFTDGNRYCVYVDPNPDDFIITVEDVFIGRRWFIFNEREIYEMDLWQTPNGHIYARYMANSSFYFMIYVAGHIYENKDDCMKDYDRKYPNKKPNHFASMRGWDKTVTKIEYETI